jgi:hypothetical protein
MCGYTLENIHSSVTFAEKHFLRAELLPYIAVSTVEINHTRVRSVVSHSQEVVVYEDTVVPTVEKNLSSVTFVVNVSLIVLLLLIIDESIQEKSHSGVKHVARDFHRSQPLFVTVAHTLVIIHFPVKRVENGSHRVAL